jgi:RNA polymerase sigma-70 factor (ECF subfamily)
MLVRDCIAGQPVALRDLVRRFEDQVFGLCFRMLGHRQDAEDAMQETFVRVFKNLHRWDPDREFEPWLLTIAGNRCRTRLARRYSRSQTQSLDYPVADRSHLESDRNHLAEEIDLAIAGLRDQHRECFLMFHQREMPYAEIAAKMDVPLGTVKTWVHRARYEVIRRLRQRGVIADELPTV